MRLKDKVAIVTGGGAGLGKAVAERYAREGARVAVAEIDAVTGQSTVEEIKRAGGDALFVRTDVAEESNVKTLVAATLERFGRIDILFNNAAVLFFGRDARAHELSNEVWDRTIAVNLRGYWLCAKYTIPAMLQQGGGVIILVASPTGLLGFTDLTAYSTSKGGVAGLMRAMAADYARDHIRVNAIVPGTMDTPMCATELADSATRQKLIDMAPLGRLGVGADIGGIAVFLASDDSSYCTGGFYMVDGGLTAV
jgi:NAD(P)-dependent dehydrogenase (short-subunit alcohol dehydrogenase family)